MSGRFDYPALLVAATVGVVRSVLADVAEHGLEGDHHFFLTFRTGDRGVRIPPALARRYPETMTIVLQHQFADLEVGAEAFLVTLRFGGAWERVRVPFEALTTFLDPSVPFGLDFTQFAGAPANGAEPGGAVGGPPGTGPVELEEEAEVADGDRAAGTAGRAPSPAPASGDLLPFRRREPGV